MQPCETFAATCDPPGHVIQFYQAGDPQLAGNVTDFLLEGLKQSDALLVIATPEHSKAFSQGLRESGMDPDTAVREQRLLFSDAEQTLHRFMVDGQPDWRRFERTVGALIREVRPEPEHGLRAYGEMVGLLWRDGQYSAAVRLEQFWNKLLSANSFQLLCAYPIDVFGKDFEAGTLDGLLCAHTHLLPASRNGDLYSAIDRATTELLGPTEPSLRALIANSLQPSWASMPEAETAILWLRNTVPDRADEILQRARLYYMSAC